MSKPAPTNQRKRAGGDRDRKDIQKLLAEKREELISEAVVARSQGREREKQQLTNRRVVIDHLIRRFEKFSTGRAIPKRVFVAFADRNGRALKNLLAKLLGKEDGGFSVVTGFDDPTTPQENILKKVLTHLNNVSVFVGILTPDVLVDAQHDTYAPSVWVTEEKGMALALGLPYLLLIHEKVDAHHWEKTARGQEVYRFTDKNKAEVFEKAVKAIVVKWQLRRESFLEAPAY